MSKRENLGSHLETLSKSLALHSSRYENLILVSDFNVFVDEFRMSGFCDTFDLKSLMKDATSYKKPRNSSSIDNALTNNPRSFQNSCVIKTNLSYFHRMIITVMKTSFEKLKPRVIYHRDYKSFENKLFQEELLYGLSNANLEERKIQMVLKSLLEYVKDALSGLSLFLTTERPSKKMKNDFYFSSKVLFVLFKFLSCLFGHVAKWLGNFKLVELVNFKIYDVTAWLTNNCNTRIVQIPISKDNQTKKIVS